MQILTPVPDPLWPQAEALWRRHFAPPGGGQGRPGHAIAALDASGALSGVMGLRDADGGFWQPAGRGIGPGLFRSLFRACPPTEDLVIDGIAAMRLRQGAGRALIEAAMAEAQRRGRPGLRAELRLANGAALAFYRSLGFCEVTRGRYGWPWGGTVLIMRRALPAVGAP